MSNETLMRELGFTDRRQGYWYNSYSLDKYVSLNLTMNKETGEWKEYVLNETFCQHEYYGYAVKEWRDEIIAKIDAIIADLKSHGLPFEVDHRAYGVEALDGEQE